MKNFLLGQKVSFTHTLFRGVGPGQNERRWNAIPTFTKKPSWGIVVGRRILQNGHVNNTSHDGMFYETNTTEWVHAESVTAWLVATDIRKKHVLVLPEHLELLKEES